MKSLIGTVFRHANDFEIQEFNSYPSVVVYPVITEELDYEHETHVSRFFKALVSKAEELIEKNTGKHHDLFDNKISMKIVHQQTGTVFYAGYKDNKYTIGLGANVFGGKTYHFKSAKWFNNSYNSPGTSTQYNPSADYKSNIENNLLELKSVDDIDLVYHLETISNLYKDLYESSKTDNINTDAVFYKKALDYSYHRNSFYISLMSNLCKMNKDEYIKELQNAVYGDAFIFILKHIKDLATMYVNNIGFKLTYYLCMSPNCDCPLIEIIPDIFESNSTELKFISKPDYRFSKKK